MSIKTFMACLMLVAWCAACPGPKDRNDSANTDQSGARSPEQTSTAKPQTETPSAPAENAGPTASENELFKQATQKIGLPVSPIERTASRFFDNVEGYKFEAEARGPDCAPHQITAEIVDWLLEMGYERTTVGTEYSDGLLQGDTLVIVGTYEAGCNLYFEIYHGANISP